MKWAYSIQTSIYWSKFMFIISWIYVIITLFEPTHVRDNSMEKWSDSYKSLFGIELFILIFLTIDFGVALYHNLYDKAFNQSNFFNTESLISDDKTANVSSPEKTPHRDFSPYGSRRNARLVKTTVHVGASRLGEKSPENLKSILENTKDTFAQQTRSIWSNLKTLYLTLLSNFLIYKLIMLVIFFVDFALFHKMYPNNAFRFSRFFRTLLFPLYSKPTRRTLQAIFHSMKRIFDYFIFFFSIVFLYAMLGYRIFYDDSRIYHLHPSYDKHVSDYNSYEIIVNSLMVLITYDNYPLVMRPFFDMSPWYLLYFMPYIFLNILFFKPVPIAVVYDGFRVKSRNPGKTQRAYRRGPPPRKGSSVHVLPDPDTRNVGWTDKIARNYAARARESVGLHVQETSQARADQDHLPAA